MLETKLNEITTIRRQCIARTYFGLVALLVASMIAVACDSSAPVPNRTAATTEAHRILIVHSYSDEFSWARDLHGGIIEGLAHGGQESDRDYRLQTFHMDTRINFTSPQQIEARATEAIGALQDFKPDILFVTDDIALEHLAVRFTEENPEDRLPVVFAGVNPDPTAFAPIESLEVPGGTITGALERIPHPEALTVARRLFPEAKKIVILADAGVGSQSVRDGLARDFQDAAEGFEVLDILVLDTFEQWQRAVAEFQDSADLIGVLNFHQLRDASGAVAPPPEVIELMVAENDVPELGLVADWARDGILVAVGNSGFKTGSYVGALGADILQGADPAAMPIIDPKGLTRT